MTSHCLWANLGHNIQGSEKIQPWLIFLATPAAPLLYPVVYDIPKYNQIYTTCVLSHSVFEWVSLFKMLIPPSGLGSNVMLYTQAKHMSAFKCLGCWNVIFCFCIMPTFMLSQSVGGGVHAFFILVCSDLTCFTPKRLSSY